MLDIIICDDNEGVVFSVSKAIDEFIQEGTIKGKIVLRATKISEVEEYLKSNTANVFLLDIDFGEEENGHDFAKRLRETDRKAYIMFLSGHLEYVFKAYEVRPFNFLPKPFTKGVLRKNLLEIYSDFMQNKGENEEDLYLNIKIAGLQRRIKLDDIIMIEKREAKTIIHEINSEMHCFESIENMDKKLEEKGFIRTHRAFICNKKHIVEVRYKLNEILLTKGLLCHIGRLFRKEVQRRVGDSAE